MGTTQLFELFDSEKSKEKFEYLKGILETRKVEFSFKEAKNISLIKCENALEDAKKHYQQIFGYQVSEFPKSLENKESCIKITPEDVLIAIKILKINPKDTHLYWLILSFLSFLADVFIL